MKPTLSFAVCAFCELVSQELEDRDLEPDEDLMYKFHLRTEHGMIS